MTTDQLHRLLLDNLSTAVLLLNTELEISFINPAAEDLLAGSASRLGGAAISPLFAEPEKNIPALTEALANGQPFIQRQTPLQLPNNSHITVDYTATPFASDSQTLLLIEMQPMDRVMKINKEEALISAHDTSRNLIRGLAHEIKNPLGGIRGAAQLLSNDLEHDSELQEYTDIITAETNRLCNLVDRLLGPIHPPKFSSVNIHEVTEHVAALIEAETRGSISLVRNYDPSIPDIKGDKEQLIQAVLNILRNATQALQSGDQPQPCIHIKSRIQRQFTIGKIHHKVVCRLDIIDNGPGIPDDIVDRIFFPMISGRAEGSGLGLPIAQAAINLHQGLIECNNLPGRTTFSLYIPLESHHGD